MNHEQILHVIIAKRSSNNHFHEHTTDYSITNRKEPRCAQLALAARVPTLLLPKNATPRGRKVGTSAAQGLQREMAELGVTGRCTDSRITGGLSGGLQDCLD